MNQKNRNTKIIAGFTFCNQSNNQLTNQIESNKNKINQSNWCLWNRNLKKIRKDTTIQKHPTYHVYNEIAEDGTVN